MVSIVEKLLIVFRVDSSNVIGAGHLMRCMALCDELSKYNCDIHFICRDLPGNLAQLIPSSEFPVHILPVCKNEGFNKSREEDVSTWIGCSLEKDADDSVNVILDLGKEPDWLIVDHYSIDQIWEDKLINHVKNIFVIDDLGRKHNCSMLLDQTVGRLCSHYEYKVGPHCQLLLGSEYALLRSEFSDSRAHLVSKNVSNDRVKKILISLGGAGSQNETLRVLNYILELGLNVIIDVVVGWGSQSENRIEAVVDKNFDRVRLHVGIDNMSRMVLDADVAIGAAGTSSLERCSLGLPSILLVLAKNQAEIARNLEKLGAAVVAGEIGSDYRSKLQELLKKVLSDEDYYKDIVKRCLELCDGLGTRRVVQRLFPSTLESGSKVYLRKVEAKDMQILFEWQKHHATRKYSRTPEIPEWGRHVEWFSSKLKDKFCMFYILVCDERPAGYVRLDRIDIKSNAYEISIAIAPEMRGMGLGKVAIKLLTELCPYSELVATVHENNQASHSLFKSMGFKYDPAHKIYRLNTKISDFPQ